MINRLIIFASSLFLVLSSQSVFASHWIPTDAVKASTVISMVESKGYHNVFDFDYSNNVYFIKAVDKDNEIVKIRVNARTNEMLSVKDTERYFRGKTYPVSMLDAVRKVEWAGIRKIYDVDYEGMGIEILGFTVNDKRAEYLVNHNTGEMVRTH